MTSNIFVQLGTGKLLSKSVEEQIVNAIKERKLSPGQKLPTELQLCHAFGVSRTVMREALRMLSARGLISIQKGRGMFVRDYSASDMAGPISLYLSLNYDRDHVLDVVHARQVIEPSIAAMAAKNRTDADILKIRGNVEELRVLNGTYEELATLDQDFHVLVARASGNPIVPLLLEPINKMMPQIKSSVYATIHDAKASAVEYHGKILESIVARDETAARNWMIEHLRIAEKHARVMLEQTTEDAGIPKE